MKKSIAGAFAGSAVLALAAGSPALAAPVTVNVRVEGPTSTIFEAPVTTDVRTFRFTGEAGEHQCDGTAATGGSSSTPVPVRNGALLTGLEAAKLPVHGTFSSFGPSFTDIGGVNVAYDAATNKYLVEYKNGKASMLGGCSDPIATGDDVLYAYGTGSETVLKLTGPATLQPGQRASLHVVNAGTGAPVAGADVGGRTSDAAGNIDIGPFAERGSLPAVKATKAGAIRSNAFSVCITDGADGACAGTVDKRPALGQIRSVTEGQRFGRGQGPRVLAGVVNADPSGLRDVQLRLTRTTAGHRCYRFDGTRERLVRTTRCGASHGRYFSVGSAAAWSYQLASRLPTGRYVLDVRTTDGAGNVDATLQRTRNRVVFHVA